jgi:pimeloyl-ACP methyl ester carboxylesterase
MNPREHSVQCLSPAGLHRMAYVEWGDPNNPEVVVCVHGLTRVSRDFDDVAQALAKRYRVVCPDVVGRGRSDWLRDPKLYAVPQYVADMVTLLARLNAEKLHWVGTSMGGLIGMGLASLPHAPIERLVLNDVGPIVKKAAVDRIAQYTGQAPDFDSVDAAVAYVKAVSAPFGLTSDAQWRRITETAIKPKGSQWTMHYDPQIAVPFRLQPLQADMELWPVYDAIRAKTLVIRGEHSDLLDRTTVAEMGKRGPKAQSIEIPNVGHAPMLMEASQIQCVTDFLS